MDTQLTMMKGVDHVKSAKIERVRCGGEGLVKFIRKHEKAENDIIQEAFYQDYGVGY